MKHVHSNVFVDIDEHGFPIILKFNDVHVLSNTPTKNINAAFTKYGIVVLCDGELYLEKDNGWVIQRFAGRTSDHLISVYDDTIIIVRDQMIYACKYVMGFLNMYPIYHCPQKIVDCIAIQNDFGVVLTPTMVGVAKVTLQGLKQLKYVPMNGSLLVPSNNKRFHVVKNNTIKTIAITGVLTEVEIDELSFNIEKHFSVNNKTIFYGNQCCYFDDTVYNVGVDVIGIEYFLDKYHCYFVENGEMRVKTL